MHELPRREWGSVGIRQGCINLNALSKELANLWCEATDENKEYFFYAREMCAPLIKFELIYV